MRKSLSCSALFALLLAASLPLAAQKVKIENQGEAAITAEARALNEAAVEDAIGKALSGRSQIVFYRSSTSPGSAVAVRDAAGSTPIIQLDPGMCAKRRSTLILKASSRRFCKALPCADRRMK